MSRRGPGHHHHHQLVGQHMGTVDLEGGIEIEATRLSQESTALSRESSALSHEDKHVLDVQDFEEDTYSSAIVSLVKDTQFLATSTKFPLLRIARMLTQVLLLWMHITVQAFLIFQTKALITAKYVHDIRDVYDVFERKMYGDVVGSNITLTVHGKARGIGGEFGPHFNAANFESLSEGEKYNVCNIPYSQPNFLRVVLCIWTFTCAYEIRTVVDLFFRLIWQLPTSETMAHATEDIAESPNEMKIVSLTKPVKTFIVATMLIPRTLLTCVLLWLGCRWLAATNCFEYLLLNAVALEFILGMPTLLFNSVVPTRTKRDVLFTKIDIAPEGEEPSVTNVLLPYMWLVTGLVWVTLYYYVICLSDLGVLPQYNFDVHNVCTQYIHNRYLD